MLTALLARSGECMEEFNGQELSILVWSVGRLARAAGLQHLLLQAGRSGSMEEHARGERAAAAAAAGGEVQGDGSLAHDAAAAAGGSSADWRDQAGNNSSSRSTGGGSGSGGGGGWMHAAFRAAQQRMHAQDLSPQGLTCLLLSAARLGCPPRDAFLHHASSYLRRGLAQPPPPAPFTPEASHQQPGAPAAPFSPLGSLSASAPLPPLDAQSLSNLLLSLAHLGHPPSGAWMQDYEAASAQLLRDGLRSQAGTQTLLAPSPGPPAAIRRNASSPAPPSSLPAPPDAHPPSSSSHSLPPALEPQHLANTLWSMAKLGWSPGSDFLGLHLTCVASGASRCVTERRSKRQFTYTFKHSLSHSLSLSLTHTHTLCRIKPAELAMVLHALSVFKARAGPDWLRLCTEQVSHSLESCARGL
jgi:hypothetical protein